MSPTDRFDLLRGAFSVSHSFILESTYHGPGDIVVVAGTLIEGIGNRYSDIDVYVITERLRSASEVQPERHHRVISTEREIIRTADPDKSVYLIHTVVPGTEIKVDVEFRTFEEVRRLASRLAAVFDYARQNLILLTMYMSDRELLLLHRLFTGKPLLEQKRYSTLLAELNLAKLCYVSYRWVASDFSDILDIMGAWEQDEEDRCLDLARENLIFQMKGYLHLWGYTNPRRKWMVPALGMLPERDERLRRRFLELCRFEGYSGRHAWRSYVTDSLDLNDEILARGSERLREMPGVPSGPAGLALLERDRDASDLNSEYSRWEYDYRAKAYGAAGAPTRAYLGNDRQRRP